ncbi:hypothetical protein [Engelhardtia mirabilis]|uniref:hypothetical protein n=1 Tax=Engelhardtia mirabilis TaxID=2528011 RepID=UPI0011A130F9
MIGEAFRIALVDSLPPETSDERRVAIYRDAHAISDEEWLGIDPNALARNVGVRMLGTGGWTIRGAYSGSASAREVFDATIGNADENLADRLAAELGEHLNSGGEGGGNR